LFCVLQRFQEIIETKLPNGSLNLYLQTCSNMTKHDSQITCAQPNAFRYLSMSQAEIEDWVAKIPPTALIDDSEHLPTTPSEATYPSPMPDYISLPDTLMGPSQYPVGIQVAQLFRVIFISFHLYL
jgi:hypothetical protein